MKILLAEHRAADETSLRSTLEAKGHSVVGTAAGPREAVALALRVRAEVVVAVLPAGLGLAEEVARTRPLPVVLVVPQRDASAVGPEASLPVFGCLVEPVTADALALAVRLARARFEEWSALRSQVVELHRQLDGRKTVERAKGILMEVRGMSEGDAYRLLQRESQNRGRSLAEVARGVVRMEGVFRSSVEGTG